MAEPKQLTSYPDSKCAWGYMVICDDCVKLAPRWVDTTKPFDPSKELLPGDRCDICNKRGTMKGVVKASCDISNEEEY